MKELLLALLVAVVGPPALSQNLTGYEKVLLPVVVENALQPLPGANGSMWQTVLSLTNRSESPLNTCCLRSLLCRIPLCSEEWRMEPGTTDVPEIIVRPSGPNPGAFLFVEAGRSSDLAVQLRVQDVSRQAETWGTSVPVVRETDLFTDRIDLIGVPSSPDFRSMLRVYDFEQAPAPRRVRVRIYAYEGRGVSGRDVVVFAEDFEFYRTGNDREPAFIQLPLPQFENLGTNNRLRVEITPLSPGLRFWGFVSVTHNATQHLTVITPSE